MKKAWPSAGLFRFGLSQDFHGLQPMVTAAPNEAFCPRAPHRGLFFAYGLLIA